MRKLFSAAFAAACLMATLAAAQTEGAGVNPGTAANRSGLGGCVYRATPAAAVDGQQMGIGCSNDGSAAVRSTPSSYALLTDATGSGPVYSVAGGNYLLSLGGTFGGSTVALVITDPRGIATTTSYTSAPSTAPCFAIATGSTAQATVTGGSPSGLNATLGGVGSGGCAGTPGTTQMLAGEAHVGEFGGNTVPVTIAQTVTASAAYTSGNAVGGLQTITGAKRISTAPGGFIQSVTVDTKSAQTTQLDMVYFNANPSGSTCTDKTAFSVAAADFDKIIGVAHVTDWTALGTPSMGQAQNLAMPFDASASTTIYACLVTRSTPTYTSTSDVSVTTRFLRN